MTAEEVVARQLEYYNAHDLGGFCSTYADDARIFRLGEVEPYIDSMGPLREAYAKRFSDEELRARIAKRMVSGDFVIDEERITERGGAERTAIVIYEVKSDLIRRVWIAR